MIMRGTEKLDRSIKMLTSAISTWCKCRTLETKFLHKHESVRPELLVLFRPVVVSYTCFFRPCAMLWVASFVRRKVSESHEQAFAV